MLDGFDVRLIVARPNRTKKDIDGQFQHLEVHLIVLNLTVRPFKPLCPSGFGKLQTNLNHCFQKQFKATNQKLCTKEPQGRELLCERTKHFLQDPERRGTCRPTLSAARRALFFLLLGLPTAGARFLPPLGLSAAPPRLAS